MRMAGSTFKRRRLVRARDSRRLWVRPAWRFLPWAMPPRASEFTPGDRQATTATAVRGRPADRCPFAASCYLIVTRRQAELDLSH
jgi:hypothetical protein